MAAAYPLANPSFTPKVDGVDYPQAADINDLQNEIVAIGTSLVTGGLALDLDPDSTAGGRDLGSTAKQWDQLHAKLLNPADATELTVATGAITVTQSYHKVDTEGDAASDDLVTITAGTGLGAGAVLILRAENVARVVTLKDTGGNLLLQGDCVLSATDRLIALLYDGTNWREIARSAPTSLTSVLNFSDTAVTNAADAVETAFTYTVPASTLATNGDTIKVVAVGTLAADTDSKTVNLFWGGTGGTLAASCTQNSNGLVYWKLEATITRIASNSQRIIGEANFYQTASHAADQQRFILTTSAQTDTGTIDIAVQLDGTNAADIVFEAARVDVTKVAS
jgi:hypothetical protein